MFVRLNLLVLFSRPFSQTSPLGVPVGLTALFATMFFGCQTAPTSKLTRKATTTGSDAGIASIGNSGLNSGIGNGGGTGNPGGNGNATPGKTSLRGGAADVYSNVTDLSSCTSDATKALFACNKAADQWCKANTTTPYQGGVASISSLASGGFAVQAICIKSATRNDVKVTDLASALGGVHALTDADISTRWAQAAAYRWCQAASSDSNATGFLGPVDQNTANQTWTVLCTTGYLTTLVKASTVGKLPECTFSGDSDLTDVSKLNTLACSANVQALCSTLEDNDHSIPKLTTGFGPVEWFAKTSSTPAYWSVLCF